MTEFILPLNIEDTVWPYPEECDTKWGRTKSGTDYLFRKSIGETKIEARIQKWYSPSKKNFEVNGSLHIYRCHKDTVQIEENTYNFKIENTLNQANIYSTKEEQEVYLDNKIYEIIRDMNLILSNVPFIEEEVEEHINLNYNKYSKEDIISSPCDPRAIDACGKIYNMAIHHTENFNPNKCPIYVGDTEEEVWNNMLHDKWVPFVGLCFDADWDDPFMYSVVDVDDDGRDKYNTCASSYMIIRKDPI